ncbi:nuclear transport factor 2 family protein [Granulicoccus phenolivorans]|uniref:nuclear transport factor 2 family protein n=1 Tax=Granulicoccus phenolivorans TaxID=266854 RepID=UPI00047EE4C3|nr:nuclear transport factor 2 family protein [Granulicoccus phenolivorans]
MSDPTWTTPAPVTLEIRSMEVNGAGDQADVDGLLAAERQRCDAFNARDRERLATVLAPGLSYLHANGVHDDFAGYLERSLTGPSRYLRRGPLDIVVIDSLAWMRGDYIVSVSPWEGHPSRTVHANALQIWIRRAGQWRLREHQGTRVVDS